MKEETIEKLCKEKGMDKNKTDLFIKFFMKRFPNESDNIHSYCNEWIDRFMTGHPIVYMDSQSKKIYLEVENE